MSEHGSVTSKASSARSDGKPKRPATVADLVKKLHGKLGHAEALSLTDHLKAAKVLCNIRNRLAKDETIDSKTLVLLLCSGIACHRRWSVGDVGETTAGASAKNEADELKMNEEARELVRASATRIFVLLCMAERQKKQHTEAAASREAVATAGLSSVWAQIAPPPKKKQKKKKRAEGEASADEDEEPEDDRREGPSGALAPPRAATHAPCRPRGRSRTAAGAPPSTRACAASPPPSRRSQTARRSPRGASR